MKKRYILTIAVFSLFLTIGCQKDELPEAMLNEEMVAQLSGTWKPVKHQLEYWKLNENIVQNGTDTMMVFENEAINSEAAYYNGIPCDTLLLNSDKTWAIQNRRPVDSNSGKDLTPVTVTQTVNGAKTTILEKSRFWLVVETINQGSSDCGSNYPYLQLVTKNRQTVKEAGKDDVVTTWTGVNKTFTLKIVESNKLIVGYQQLMSVSYKPGVLPGQPDQKTNRNVTNTITFAK